MPKRQSKTSSNEDQYAYGAAYPAAPGARASREYGMGNPSPGGVGQPGHDTYQQPAQGGAPFQQYQQANYGQAYQQPYSQYAIAGMYVPPATSVPQEQKKKKRGAGFWIGIGIAVLALIAAAVLAWFMFFGNQQSNRAGTLGQLDGKTDAEIQAELNRIVEEGMFNISIASVVQFTNGTSEGDLRIENVPGNPYLMQVEITRDDTGQQIYESGVLEPNYHIQTDRLNVALPKGSYLCTATFHALDAETEEEVGTAGAQVLIEVLN